MGGLELRKEWPTSQPRRLASAFCSPVLDLLEVVSEIQNAATLIDGDPCTWDDLGTDELEQAISHIEFILTLPIATISA